MKSDIDFQRFTKVLQIFRFYLILANQNVSSFLANQNSEFLKFRKKDRENEVVSFVSRMVDC